MANKYKLLILDYGGVYSFSHVPDSFNQIMQATFGKRPNQSEKLKISKLSQLLGQDKISSQEYVTQVSAILKLPTPPPIELFEEATIKITNPPTPEMVNLVHTIRRSGIKVSLLSDMYMFEAKLTRPWGRYEGFDYVSLSAEAGMTKHNPKFFDKTLNHFQTQPEEAVFVDDKLKNIEVAKTVGLNTLFADKTRYKKVQSLVEDIYLLLGVNQR